MMAHLQQVLSAEEVRRLQDCAARARWQDGRATAGDLLARQKNNEQVDVNSAEGEVVAQVVREGLQRHPVFTAAALPARITPPMLNRYVIGMEYGAHVDASIMGGAQPLRADLSATLFLSEPDDYDGGELIIEAAQGRQSVKLPAGDLLLYPSTSLHFVTPVRRGQRVAVIFWVQSMVASAEQRALLWELSQAIASVQPRLGDAAECARLIACYHNLIRMWAQP